MTHALTVTEARATLPGLLDRVDAGEEITITRHGRPVAVVVRPDRLKVRRDTTLRTEAKAIGELLDVGRRTAISDTRGLSAEAAEDLVAEVRRDRDQA